MQIKDCEVRVIQGDITELEVDALVNAANNKLLMGGGVAGAIKRRGGQSIEDEAVKRGPIKIGEAIETKAGKLKARFVIHAATMGMDFKTDEIKIRDAAKSSLRLAKKLHLKSIAFPALGCGTGGFPLLASAKIMAQETFRHLREDEPTLKEIIFCLFDKEALAVFNKGVLSYLEYIVHKLQNGPFTTVDAVIEIDDGIILIERSNPPFGWALPGGFVDYGESLEDAVRREAKEETDVELEDLRQFHTYSDPKRDPRFHTIGTVFTARAKGRPKAGDDAASFKIVKFDDLLKLDYAFDHKKIIADYLKIKK
ncbi:MAG: macro domain-containing protein [Candidatus Omnitrophica bacterium]|nr:macro domain-containing protein [Candidatus Omnitrophota bacterium]MDD5236702.1 macro domain-containing protein [Candidatus Omnitrophota bacterium]MDD5610915.1 macro domain-containing protein [Candidatus Omnitrophota bacterium]